MTDKLKDKANRDKMINQVMLMLQDMGDKLRADNSNSLSEMLPQADVLLDTMHFLRDYEKNIQVLNEYWLHKRQQLNYNDSEYLEELEK